jgi:hypothetical protein
LTTRSAHMPQYLYKKFKLIPYKDYFIALYSENKLQHIQFTKTVFGKHADLTKVQDQARLVLNKNIFVKFSPELESILEKVQ